MIHRVSDRSFSREVLLSPVPVLVHFTAEECGPCRIMWPALEQFAAELDGRVKVVSLDVNQNPESRARYDIHGLPTLIIFANGEIAARRIGGLMQWNDLQAWFEAAVSSRR